MGQLHAQRGSKVLWLVLCALALLLALPAAAGATKRVCSGKLAQGGGQSCIGESPKADPLQPSCATGFTTTYLWWLQIPNNAVLQGGQLLNASGQPYSPSNPLCGSGSTFSNFAVTDNTGPGGPPTDGPQFHWVQLSVTVQNVPQSANNTTPAVQPQVSFNDPFCHAQAAQTPLIRIEGITERIGDLLLTCTGGQPVPSGEQVPSVNLTLKLNTNVTSGLLVSSGPFSEALALIDDPSPANQRACVPSKPGGTCLVTGGASSSPNVFQGSVAGHNAVDFLGVPFDPPSPTLRRTIRLTNLRANASGLPSGTTAVQGTLTFSSSLFGATQAPVILGQLGSGPFGLLVGPHGGTFTAPAYPQCGGQWEKYGEPGTLEFRGSHPDSFLPRSLSTQPSNPGAAPASQDVPGQTDHSETGFFNSSFPTIPGQGNLGLAGLATFGDRLLLAFTGVPGGVQVVLPLHLTGLSGGQAVRVMNPAGPFAPFKPAPGLRPGLAQVPLSGGAGTAAFEIVAPDNGHPTAFRVPVFLRVTGSPGTGEAKISGGLGPLSTDTGASATGPVPRFHALPLAPTELFTIHGCH